ncbi:peptide chain release factor N(5)-glutamine methyltransferase [Flavobacterium sp. CYK-4]|uniref:peptide chain release factor N(5)-glutamine methyltransferase n=1 Tax=Flavobacterium lotistagni TaxID=2709660 RepID=UPI001408C1B4|nr:peptide chain release factor N(5)-glutamine methyltransferase [Flavobacterium lotistagni]NHM07323.1 peptide chain release factor N(5)-glutamine methyltransferase [Flavobacterium lotistagni]
MLIKNYRISFIEQLTPIYDAVEAESLFYLALQHYHQLRRVDLAMQPDLVLTAAELENWQQMLEKLKQEVPIQYIIGKTSFYGLEFEVNPNVLIPRQETEELVDWMLSDLEINANAVSDIIDIGTGSGCIAISLAKNLPHIKVSAIDISEKALEVAKRNATYNAVAVDFLQQNILQVDDLGRQIDLIVSNPPYVRNLEKAEIRKNVLEHEPHLALFVADDDALIFYRKIAVLAMKNLKASGKLYFEINQYLGNEMIHLLEKMGFVNIELRKDIYGNDRMIRAAKPNYS